MLVKMQNYWNFYCLPEGCEIIQHLGKLLDNFKQLNTHVSLYPVPFLNTYIEDMKIIFKKYITRIYLYQFYNRPNTKHPNWITDKQFCPSTT